MDYIILRKIWWTAKDSQRSADHNFRNTISTDCSGINFYAHFATYFPLLFLRDSTSYDERTCNFNGFKFGFELYAFNFFLFIDLGEIIIVM
jgi:hypothetical protein